MATMTKRAFWFYVTFAIWAAASFNLCADQVVMQNGDRYHGKVLSVSATNVVLQSEVLGVVTLSRGQVVNLAMGAAAPTHATNAAQPAKTNASTDLSAAVRQLGTQSNLVNQVRAQLLATANPEANQKFDQLLGDLGAGKMSINDLRAQARSAAVQLRELEKEAGDDSPGTIGLYLSVLENFLAETESGPAGVNTNAAARKQR